LIINNVEDIKNIILSLEDKFPVDTWSVNSIDAWPILRVRLFTELNKTYVNKLVRKPSDFGGTKTLSSTQRIKRFFNTFFNFQKLKKTDNIYTSTFSHRALYKNKYYSKFYEPILIDVNSSGIIIEHNSKHFYNLKEIYNKDKVLFFEDFVYVTDFIYSQLNKVKLYNPIKNANLAQYDLFLNNLKSLNLPLSLREKFELNTLKITFLKLDVYVKVYSKILRKTKPKYTFQVCHYSTNSIALSIASKKLNIPSVEIQHGPQPPFHLSYGLWSKVKQNGYNTLPTVFWNWDKNSYNTINHWQKEQQYHKAIVLGNTWLDYLKPKLTEGKKEYVLYSLQPMSFNLLFPDYLVDFIKKSPLKFWLRIHPTDINRKQDYIKFLKENELTNYVYFDDGSTYSLPETLAFSKIHVTYSSGCAIEAAHFGVKTILLDSRSVNYYQELINNKMAFIASNNVSFISHFNELISNNDLYKTQHSNKNYKVVFEELDTILR
jgi:hypothetical protein